jgi:hydrogenase/urease accessory protein HupE
MRQTQLSAYDLHEMRGKPSSTIRFFCHPPCRGVDEGLPLIADPTTMLDSFSSLDAYGVYPALQTPPRRRPLFLPLTPMGETRIGGIARIASLHWFHQFVITWSHHLAACHHPTL